MPPVLRWRGVGDVPSNLGPSAVAIGVFDGVHRGHAEVVGRAVAAANAADALAVVVTFDPHPVEVLRPGVHVPRLATLPRRLELLAELGVAATLVLPFTAAVAAEPAELFVSEILVRALRARAVVVGADFRFGHGAAGDVALLRELGIGSGFEVHPVELVGEGGERWSSTQVREALAAGRVEAAAHVLGRRHRLDGVVVAGARRGRELGFPTANLQVSGGVMVPADGVYAGYLDHRGERLPAAISVGTNPTFGATERTVEAFVLDRTDLDLYGQEVAIEFAARLRGMERFDGVDELKAAMAQDVHRARLLLT
jgi:riboflavin kinase/FMN adenylyltransferase